MTDDGPQTANDNPQTALGRLEKALGRLEKAVTRPSPRQAEVDELRRQRDTMRARIAETLREMDDLIAALTQSGSAIEAQDQP